MLITDLFVALLSGLVIVALVSMVFGTKGPWDSHFWFFIVVALFAWAGGKWLLPIGPVWRGVGWVPIVLMGTLAAMLLTAASPRTYRRRQLPENHHPNRVAVDAFVWIVVISLLLLAVSRYAWYPWS